MPPKRCSGKRENKTARRESKWSSFCLKGSRYARTGSHKARDEGIALAERGLIFLFCLGGGGEDRVAIICRLLVGTEIQTALMSLTKNNFFIPEYTYRNSPIDNVKLKQNKYERIIKTFLTPYLASSPLPTQIHAVT